MPCFDYPVIAESAADYWILRRGVSTYTGDFVTNCTYFRSDPALCTTRIWRSDAPERACCVCSGGTSAQPTPPPATPPSEPPAPPPRNPSPPAPSPGPPQSSPPRAPPASPRPPPAAPSPAAPPPSLPCYDTFYPEQSWLILKSRNDYTSLRANDCGFFDARPTNCSVYKWIHLDPESVCCTCSYTP